MKEPNHVFQLRSTESYNRLWQWCKINKKPFLALEKKQKYGRINYDMWVINYDLTEKAIKELDELRWEVTDRNFKEGGKKSVWSSIGQTCGFVSDILISLASEAFPRFEAIIYNEENWVSIISKSKRMET